MQLRLLTPLAFAVLPLGLNCAHAQEWKPLFNGKDLSGWSGDPRLWRVDQGVLVGETDQDQRKVGVNTFLIWQGGEPSDFEIEFKGRVTGDNNSGLQYRSKVLDAATWSVGGYQMDMHPAANYLGMLYEERGRGIACESGQQVELADKPKVTGKFDRPAVKLEDWNTYRVVARGDTLQHFVNDKEVAEIHDVDAGRRALKGSLALQLHAGPSMKAEFKDIRIRTVAPGKVTAAAKVAEPSAKWIWQKRNAADGEKAFFRREFELPKDLVSATVTVTGDNWQRVWVNGKDLGWSSEWSVPASHDIIKLVRPGERNVITVEGRNQEGVAAIALRFSATLKDGKKIFLVSDDKWLANLEGTRGWTEDRFDAKGWTPAVVIATMGDAPWGNVIEPESSGSSAPEDVTADFSVVDGFRVERLYKVPGVQGSWVAMTIDGNGKLLCSDQYGKIYRVEPPANSTDPTVVTPTAIPLSGAHGLLWHNGVLYVTVNEGGDKAGVYKVTDSDHDGEPDKPELLLEVNGRGEHGPHGLAASPDGKYLYVIAGNFTDLPKMDSSLPPQVWQEDQLLPRRPDAKGHAHDRMAPGGWVARMNLTDSKWQLFAMGFRNGYDLAFDWKGDLFTYDSDMEWDLGTPWYRPTRICHVVPGAEFGWRNGSGPWPQYYEDSMYPQLDMGPGSPTGVLSGRGAKFPAKYQKAIYALDWTYATIHAIHLTPEGRGYKAEREDFLAGSGLPVTDAVIGKDGAMYFLTGGRRTASSLWRVTYKGAEPTTPVPYEAKPLELASANGAWEGMGSPDRLTRYESRLAVEAAGAAAIVAELPKESDSWRVIEGAMALARTGSASQRKQMLDSLNGLDWAKLDKPQQLNWLRAAGLVFARHGQPNDAERAAVLAKIDAAFPSLDSELNRELCRMLSYLQAPGIVGRTLALMDNTGPALPPDWLQTAKRNSNYGGIVERMVANLPPAQVIHYIYCLRVVKGPWSPDERKRFFAWFDTLLKKSGGESYAGFIKDLRNQTLATCTTEEKSWIEKLSPATTPNPLADLPRVTGPGREWSVSEIERLANEGLSGRSKENGKKMFQASLCAACHRFDGEGGSAGPDLTAVGGRFSVRDLAEAILEPSKVVSDQYAFDVVTKQDGSQIVGKLIEEKDEHWILATSPFDFSATMEIERNQIKEIKPSPISPMPAALVNRLNPDELKDLLAYLLNK
ncbi:family 16 glycoside hydrolase [Haloferula sp. BvORR071]|uniref:family 16 glycoside hydrolase n=1 Tax=Haloferula sp. BvORR071 TaxID=1396141 RepID=UPI0006961661|nr:family 16 glycoside hydrolase [Haloferula sp. BvORR071]